MTYLLNHNCVRRKDAAALALVLMFLNAWLKSGGYGYKQVPIDIITFMSKEVTFNIFIDIFIEEIFFVTK